jgi:ubiquinone/menaquinone biosynthesis C-methylase UbiE
MGTNRNPDAPRKSFSGKGVYPASQARWLLHPLRRFIMSPRRMVERLHLTPTDRVLEIGPGPGWFSPALAAAIPDGRLTLFDIQPEMLEMAARRLRAAGLSNFVSVEGDARRLPFEEAVFDLVFLVTVLGEIPDPGAAMREIGRVLRPGGRVSITEQLGDPDHVKRATLEQLAASAGLAAEGCAGSPLLRTCVFRRPSSAP